MIDVADDNTGEQDARQGYHGVESGLDSRLEELTGVVVEEEPASNDRGKHYDGPEHTAVHIGLAAQAACSRTSAGRATLSRGVVSITSRGTAGAATAATTTGGWVWVRFRFCEVVPAVEDGLLAEVGEAVPVGRPAWRGGRGCWRILPGGGRHPVAAVLASPLLVDEVLLIME